MPTKATTAIIIKTIGTVDKDFLDENSLYELRKYSGLDEDRTEYLTTK